MSQSPQPRLAADESISATFMRAMLAPVVPLGLLVTGVVAGVAPWIFFLLIVLLLAVAGLAMMTALSPGLAVFGNRLEVTGEPDVHHGLGGVVNLAALNNVKSVSSLGGRVSTTGPSVFRSRILLEDAYGGRALFPAWGWSPKKSLQTVLREAALDTGADIDEMSYWRLGFRNNEYVKVSPLRRFL
ncbi:hypothetical protein [Nocardioides cynanchi]|uniref:hypothetical protein n=1 Tax=Nocardioides cynanchi TaxID=2558918 RepID=UPI001244C395|nr:hypothetical protein [Nocardioides cynanchi]